jgi:hypothetical protein
MGFSSVVDYILSMCEALGPRKRREGEKGIRFDI